MSKKNLYNVTICNKRTGELISDDAIRFIEGYQEALAEKREWERNDCIVDMFKMNEGDINYELTMDDEATTYYTKKPISLWLIKGVN